METNLNTIQLVVDSQCKLEAFAALKLQQRQAHCKEIATLTWIAQFSVVSCTQPERMQKAKIYYCG